MQKFKFNIYVGNNFFMKQSKNIIAVVEPKFYIPSGQFELDGKEKNARNIACFKKIYDAGTYIADWIDLFGNEDAVSANIMLNVRSLHKTFVGKSIIDILDKIDKKDNFKEIRNFSELN